MLSIKSFEELNIVINRSEATLVLFGGEHCGVCQSIKPKLEDRLTDQFSKLTQVYIDCQMDPKIGAQSSVFSLPVVRVYFEGQLFIEEIKAFSLSKLFKEIERPYNTLFT